MARYLTRRVVQMFFLFILFLTVTFFLLNAIPGDIIAVQFASNPNLPPEAREIAVARLGLDKPLWERYADYMVRFFQGDFGFSFVQYPREVSDIIAERLPRTLVLFLTALTTYYWAGFLAGKFLAWRRGKRGELGITVGGVTLYTAFYPWFALIMIWVFAFYLGWLPIGKFLDPQEWRDAPYSANRVFVTMFLVTAAISIIAFVGLWFARRVREARPRLIAKAAVWAITIGLFVGYWTVSDIGSTMRVYAADIAQHMILPVAVLTIINFAGIMLLTRSSMLETMREDFILTARAKGLTEKQVRDRHAARTALLPVTTSLVLAIASVIDGGILTETVFSWPGMGQLLVQSVTSEDIPLAIAAFSFIGILALVGHLVVDIMYGFLDPRIRVTSQG